MSDRLKKVDALRESGINPYANGFEPRDLCAAVLATATTTTPPDMGELADDAERFTVAGRVMAKNKMGKAMFLRVRDRSVGVDPDGPRTLQIYAKRDILGEEAFAQLKAVDIGDFIGLEGPLFSTRTGEPTLMVRDFTLLTKSVRPLPEKFHGLTDVETRFRQRYVDLTMNPEVSRVFRTRAQVLSHLREFFEKRDYIEVETPMMHPIPGGATARPFETHHNALDIPLYMRIAPELYLKRLLVGGLGRVFEINRNFRNEGLSPKHNPEFTMLEFYQAYATYEDLIALTEELFCGLAQRINGSDETTRPFGEHVIDYARPFARHTVRESLTAIGGIPEETVADDAALRSFLAAKGIEIEAATPYGLVLMVAFDALVEPMLIQPTFITEYPIENSPLSRRNEADDRYVDRFEIFVAGMELGNAFSELNDPADQRERFESQVAQRDAGDNEAMFMDLDYVRALEYGMPPAAGEGVGVDRLVMLMTDTHTIREVILFPQMRPE
ncbi:MAG: lysine--tRNA ligase [Myxococcota bacterium]